MTDKKMTFEESQTGKHLDLKLINNLDDTYSYSVRDGGDAMGRQSFNSTFGEKVVGTRQNNINIPFIRNNGNIGTEEALKSTNYFSSGTGDQEHENETAYVKTGVGIGYAEIRSKNTNRYVTGHGNDTFHTMVLPSAPENNTYSWVGYGSLKLSDCIGFGTYNLDYGIWLKLRNGTLANSFIPRSEWNINDLTEELNDGLEVIGGTSFGWLGVADIDFFIYLSNNTFVHVHKHRVNNVDNKPHLSDPTQPISIGIERTSGTGANLRIGTSSWFAGTVGNRATGTGADKFPFIKRSAVSVSGGTETVLLSIRNREEFPVGKKNNVRLRYGTVTITSDGTKSVEFNVYLNGVPYDNVTHDWGYYDENLSVSELNINAPLQTTSRTIVTGLDKINEQIGGTYLGKVDRDRINLFSQDVVISANAGDILTFTAKSSNSTVIDFEIRWIEEF